MLSEIAARRDELAFSPATPAFRAEEIVMMGAFPKVESSLEPTLRPRA
jgi:hypothetical protein